MEEAGRRLTAGKAQGSVIGMYGDVCPPPPSSFYKSIGQLNGPWESKGRRMSNFTVIAKFVPDFNCKVK